MRDELNMVLLHRYSVEGGLSCTRLSFMGLSCTRALSNWSSTA